MLISLASFSAVVSMAISSALINVLASPPENLFTNYSQIENNAPLADKLRPKNLEDFFGQQSILNENSLLRSAILNDKISNFIFSGPPGVGKTTLIEIISFNTRSKLIKLNAVLSSVKELRNEISNAKERLINSKRKQCTFGR